MNVFFIIYIFKLYQIFSKYIKNIVMNVFDWTTCNISTIGNI